MSRDYENAHGGARVATRRRRYWMINASPERWYPWGLLQVIGLGILFLVGGLLSAPRIEADVRSQVTERLHGAGILSAQVSSSGQSVSIQASAAETSNLVVRTIASSTRCQTWAGQLSCPTTIDVQLEAPAERDAKDEISRAAEPAVFNVGSANGSVGCDEQFETTLSSASVRFQSGSAVIDPVSEVLLEQLADVAVSCSGDLLVEGHTDSRGNARMNNELSQMRADMVRAALVRHGVEPARLTAEGYGEQRPVADNGTADGRATNRRIVIRTRNNN